MSKSKKRHQQRQQVQQRRTTTRPTVVDRSEAKAVMDKERSRRQRAAVAKKLSLIVLVIVVVTGIGYLVFDKIRSDVDAPGIGSVDQELVLGSADAPHDVIIYEDFACPACAALERELDGQLASLAAEGKVRVSYRPINLLGSGWSVEAAEAFAVVTENSEPEVAAAFHDILFANSSGGTDAFVQWATQAGADGDVVRKALESDDGAEWVKKATEAAKDAGVSSTPTVLLDGDVFEEKKQPADRAKALLDELR